MSGYTGESMMAAAERHYRAAEKNLETIDSSWGHNVITNRINRATAHTQAGLLAVELAKYALSPGNDDGDGFQ